jgi:hypothetical protein
MKRILALAALCTCMPFASIGLSNRPADAALSTAAVPPISAQLDMLPAAPLLNADGTLNLQTGASGMVDLAGWRVSLDPQRGPVFAPEAPTSAAWSALGNGMNGIVNTLAVSGSDVYVGGLFTQICGNAACNSGNSTANHVAKWNGSAWSALGNGVDGNVDALAVSGSDVYVGGNFTQICGNAACNSGNTTANRVAKWNGSAWSTLGSGVNGTVDALAVSGSDVYVGGEFTQVCGYLCLIGNNTVNHIAKWNGSAWSALGSGVNDVVYALAVSGSNVYAGGRFTFICLDYLCNTYLNSLANHVARWNGSAWSFLGNGVNDTVVTLLVVSPAEVYVGGYFTQICGDGICYSGNVTVNHVAKWDYFSWFPLGNGVDGWVGALAGSGSDVYLGGGFTQSCGDAICNSGNVRLNHIGKWSSATSTWSAFGNGVDNAVDALAGSGNDVYVGGGFTQICGNAACNSGNSTVSYVAKYGSTNLFLPLIMR